MMIFLSSRISMILFGEMKVLIRCSYKRITKILPLNKISMAHISAGYPSEDETLKQLHLDKITPEMIEVKREQLKLHRGLKQLKKGVQNGLS